MTRTSPRQPWELTTEERIRAAGWFPGGEREWEALPIEERERLSFAATGCAVAYPTWPAPVRCAHIDCRVLRGEQPKIAALNHQMRGEAGNGWWRFIGRPDGRGGRSPEGRRTLARLYRHYRKIARQRGVYDLWKMGGVEVALVGVLA